MGRARPQPSSAGRKADGGPSFSILKLRQACTESAPDKEQDELIEAMWENPKGDLEELIDHENEIIGSWKDTKLKEPRSNIDASAEVRSECGAPQPGSTKGADGKPKETANVEKRRRT